MRTQCKAQTGPRRWGIKVLATALGLFFVLGVGQINAEEFTVNCQGPGGPVVQAASSMTLEAGVNYTVQVAGTFSFWPDIDWESYILKLEGDLVAPENHMGLDTEYCFAVPLGDSGQGKDPTGATWFYFAKETVNGNVQWFDPVPNMVGYNPGHVYTYTVLGAGEPLQITLFDAVDWNVANNLGSLLHIIITADGGNPGPGIDPEVPLDIKPTSCPNPINTKSPGVLPVAILGTADFDVTTIDTTQAIKLAGVTPLKKKHSDEWWYSFEDVAAPYEPYMGKVTEMDCTTAGPDGYLDLTLKFDKKAIVDAIASTLPDEEVLVDGQAYVVEVSGFLLDGEGTFVGEDVVRIMIK